MNKLFGTLLLMVGLVQVAGATSIVSINGTDTIEYQIGPQYLAQSWTSLSEFQNVSVSAAINTFGTGSRTAQAFLMTQLGPATTVADQIASALINLPVGGDALVPIFSGLDLPAGNYFLLFAGQNDGNDGWVFTSNANVTTGAGITYNGGMFVLGTAQQNSYPPASTFIPYTDRINSGRMVVTGAPVPEPASLVLLGTGLVATVSRFRRRRLTPKMPQ